MYFRLDMQLFGWNHHGIVDHFLIMIGFIKSLLKHLRIPYQRKNLQSLFKQQKLIIFVSRYLNKRLDYVASPSTVIPLLVLLILIIYYLISLTGALREANEDLKIQLKRERTEERKKMLKIAQPGVDQTNAPIAISDRWKKVLASTSPLTPSGAAVPEPDEMKIQARKGNLLLLLKSYPFHFYFYFRTNCQNNEKSIEKKFFSNIR